MTAPAPSWMFRPVLLGAVRFLIAAAVFAGAQVFATDVLDADHMPLALVIVAAGVVAAIFWATNASLQQMIDRLLFGEQAGGFEAGRALLQRMATTLPVDDILPALAEAAGRTTHSARAEVRVLLSDGQPWSQVWPPRAVADGWAPVTIGVRHAGTRVGEIEVDLDDPAETARDRILLDDLARPAGLALSTVRLTVELRRRAAQLQALTEQLEWSNSRIVHARRTEIARLRGEMTQRVIPHIDRADAILAHQIAELNNLPTAPTAETGSEQWDRDSDPLDRALAEVADALESLRTLARGIYPPRLADAGLAVSLEGWQQRSGVGVELRLLGRDDVLHRHADIEACLYFSLVTVLGAVGAGPPRPVASVHFSATGVEAVVSGAAAADAAAGEVHTAAVQAVRDRIEAFDGWLAPEVPAAPDGFSLRLWLPLADTPAPAQTARADQ